MNKLAFSLSAVLITALISPVNAGITVDKISAKQIDLNVTIPRTTAANKTTVPGLEASDIDFSKGIVPINSTSAIPGFTEWILIPNGTTAQLSVDQGEPLIYHNVTFPDGQGENGEISPKKGTVPGVFAELEPVKELRGQSCTKVWVYPYQYDPLARTLSVYQNCKVSITFNGSVKSFNKQYFDEIGSNMLKRMAINAEAVLNAEGYVSGLSKKSAAAAGYNYLIITHDDFFDAATMLASWKNSIGITTRVVKTSEIGVSPSTTDIESFIDHEYTANNPPPAYLLVLGDYQFVPPYMDPYSSVGYNQTPSDWKYADIGDDYMVDLAYGRIPVNTAQNAVNVITRIINHEKLSRFRPEFKKAALVASWEGGESESRRFVKSCEDIRNFLIRKGSTADRVYHAEDPAEPMFFNSGVSPETPEYYRSFYLFENDIPKAPLPNDLKSPSFAWNGSASSLTNAINDGRFLVVYHGHGSTDAWVSMDDNVEVFNSNYADNLNNSFLPVIFSYACHNGRFNETQECLTEHLLERDSGGAVGVFSSNNELKSLGFGERMIWGCMDALYPDFIESNGGNYGGTGGTPLYRAGDIANYGKHYVKAFFKDLTNNWGVGYDSLNTMQMEWYGDPTMEIIPMTTNKFGDVNNDGMITINDALCIAKYSANEIVNPFHIDRADVNQDGKIDINDALIIAKFSAGLSSQEFDVALSLTKNNIGDGKNTIKIRSTTCNSLASIECQIAAPTRITVKIFDVEGRYVETLSNNQLKNAGLNSIAWDRKTYSPGVYFVRIYTNDKIASTLKTMVRD